MGAFGDYLNYERGFSKRTVTAYLSDLRQFVEWLNVRGLDEVEPRCVTRVHLRAFLADRMRDHAASSMGRSLAALRHLFRYLRKRGELEVDPSEGVRAPRMEKTLPPHLSVDGIQTLLAKDVAGDSVLGLRDQAMFEILYGSGLRVAELRSLDFEHLENQHRQVRVVGKGAKERIVPLTAPAREALIAYLGIRSQLEPRAGHESALFLSHRGTRITPRGITYLLRKRLKATGIDRLMGPHALRHSLATHLLAGGADIRVIQEILGHATVRTTQKYTHVGIEALVSAYDKAHPRAKNGSNNVSDKSV